MSYSFGMYFCSCESRAAALEKAADYVKVCSSEESIRKMIEESTYFIPSVRYHLTDHENIHLWQMLDEYWLKGVMTLRFVWWEKYNLLGLVGFSYPEVENYFPGFVNFQNSCDQDYEESTWLGICPFFDSVVEKYKTASAKELLSDDEYEDYTEEEIEKSLEYHRRNAMYKAIYEQLELGGWLYGHDSETFERITLNCLQTSEMTFDMNRKYLRPAVKSALSPHYNECSAIVPVETVTEDGKRVLNHYQLRYPWMTRGKDGRAQICSYNSVTTDTFKASVHDALKEFLATDDGKRLATEVDVSDTAKLLRVVPDIYLRRHGIVRMSDERVFDVVRFD